MGGAISCVAVDVQATVQQQQQHTRSPYVIDVPSWKECARAAEQAAARQRARAAEARCLAAAAAEDSKYCFKYTAKGGSEVRIPTIINSRDVLGVKANASRQELKLAFREKITTPNRQKRAVVSYAAHMLSGASSRYDKNSQNYQRLADAFDYSITGHTAALARALDADPGALKREDMSGRTLLYIAAKSGFYDTCEYLLKHGARPISCGDVYESTPLHAAAFYGHGLICMLLLSHGASASERNSFGNTAADEAKDAETRQQILRSTSNSVAALALSAKGLLVGRGVVEELRHGGKVVAKVLRHRENRRPMGWKCAWHGTRMKYVQSIMRNGLQAAGTEVGGTLIKPPKGHYELGSTHFGIKKWAHAIFLSPSVLYAGHPAYSERIIVDDEQWCVLLRTCCRPGSYTGHESTVLNNDPVDGEPTGDCEWRVDVEGDDMIWRHNKASDVIVTAAIFVRLSFFDSIGGGGPSYRAASRLLTDGR